MDNKNEVSSLREEIKMILMKKFPSSSESKIHWRNIQRANVDSKLLKETTLRRYLGAIKDKNSPNPEKYENKEILTDIKNILNGTFRKSKEKISISSSNTANFEGYYLVLSPSTVPKNINLFPLEIYSNGDFELRYIHPGDIIRGITSFNASHISFYASRKYNEIIDDYLPFCLHSVFNVQASNSRNDLQPFNLGVATRRKRNTAGLKAVIEILIKIDKVFYDSFDLTGLTLEKDEDNNLYLLKGTKDYLDKESSIRLLESEIEVDTIAKKGEIKLIKKTLADVVNAFYDLLIEDENSIHLDEDLLKQIYDISEKLKNEES